MNKINIEEESELGNQTQRETGRNNIGPNIIVSKNGKKTVKKKYPNVGYILLDNIYDATENNKIIIQDKIDKKYNCGQHINISQTDDEIGLDIEFLNQKLQDFSANKRAEGLKLNLKAHGDERLVICCKENTVDILEKIAPYINDFLNKRKKAKLYIEIEACMGANIIERENGDGVDVYALLNELFQKNADRIYCRCCKTGQLNRFYEKQEPLLEKHFCQRVKKNPFDKQPKTSSLQYFPLSNYQSRQLKCYGGKEAKAIKNKALGFTKNKPLFSFFK